MNNAKKRSDSFVETPGEERNRLLFIYRLLWLPGAQRAFEMSLDDIRAEVAKANLTREREREILAPMIRASKVPDSRHVLRWSEVRLRRTMAQYGLRMIPDGLRMRD